MDVSIHAFLLKLLKTLGSVINFLYVFPVMQSIPAAFIQSSVSHDPSEIIMHYA